MLQLLVWIHCPWSHFSKPIFVVWNRAANCAQRRGRRAAERSPSHQTFQSDGGERCAKRKGHAIAGGSERRPRRTVRGRRPKANNRYGWQPNRTRCGMCRAGHPSIEGAEMGSNRRQARHVQTKNRASCSPQCVRHMRSAAGRRTHKARSGWRSNGFPGRQAGLRSRDGRMRPEIVPAPSMV